jgi:hypothetical protein
VAKSHLRNRLFRTFRHLKITNQTDEETLDDREDDGRIVFEMEQLIIPYLEVYLGLVMWDVWWTKWRWGMFSSSTSVSLANLHSTNFSTITYYLGLVQ